MARILIAFFNGIDDPLNPNAIPCFYESFIKGLEANGNELLIYAHPYFGWTFGEINQELKEEIIQFNPDICFIFNNAFYDLAGIVDVPIIVYEVDSPNYYSNKENLMKNPNRYTYFVAQHESIQILLDEYKIDESRIHLVPFFTSIHADDSIEQRTNVSFIGSKFSFDNKEEIRKFICTNPSNEERIMYAKCIEQIRQNPFTTVVDLIEKFQITSKKVAYSIDVSKILMQISDEKRIQVLSAVAEFGLDLYGSPSWWTDYYYNSKLNLAYRSKRVYSLAHNQEIYNTSKIGISVAHAQAISGFPWRIMDIMASNACLITDRHAAFDEYFPELQGEMPIYENPYEAYYLCKKYLEENDRRKEFVLKCNEVINQKYRFEHLLQRMEEITGIIMSKK